MDLDISRLFLSLASRRQVQDVDPELDCYLQRQGTIPDAMLSMLTC
jgi:hypothetical protein